MNNRRPVEEAIDLEIKILEEKFRKDGLQPPSRDVLLPIAREEHALRMTRQQRQEFFNQRKGWGNKPFANLLGEVSK